MYIQYIPVFYVGLICNVFHALGIHMYKTQMKKSHNFVKNHLSPVYDNAI